MYNIDNKAVKGRKVFSMKRELYFKRYGEYIGKGEMNMIKNLRKMLLNKSIQKKLYLGYSAIIAQVTVSGLFSLLFMTLLYKYEGNRTLLYFVGIAQLIAFMKVQIGEVG